MKIKMVIHKHIPESEIKIFLSEIETWKQLLNSRMEENVMLKIQLSDILKNKYDPNRLETIEAFQAQFISHDEHIFKLRKEAADLYNLLTNDPVGLMIKSNEQKIVNMRADMTNSENQFNNLLSAFNDFQNEIYRREWNKA